MGVGARPKTKGRFLRRVVFTVPRRPSFKLGGDFVRPERCVKRLCRAVGGWMGRQPWPVLFSGKRSIYRLSAEAGEDAARGVCVMLFCAMLRILGGEFAPSPFFFAVLVVRA